MRTAITDTVQDQKGNAVKNARVWVFARGSAVVASYPPTGTAVTGLLYATSGGATVNQDVTPFLTDDLGRWTIWCDTAQYTDVVVTDNNRTAYVVNQPTMKPRITMVAEPYTFDADASVVPPATVQTGDSSNYIVDWDNLAGTATAYEKSTGLSLFSGADYGAVANQMLAAASLRGPNGSQGLGSPGAKVMLGRLDGTNVQVPMNSANYIGKPIAAGLTAVCANGSSVIDFGASVTVDSTYLNRIIYVRLAGAGGTKDLVARIDGYLGNGVTTGISTTHQVHVNIAAGAVGTGEYCVPITIGIKLEAAGSATANQGNGHPDDGSFLLQAQGAGWDRKGVIDFRNAPDWTHQGFGAENFQIEQISVDANGLADYAQVGFGVGTGNMQRWINPNAQGGRVANFGIGNHADHAGSSDVLVLGAVCGAPTGVVSKTWQGGVATLPQATITLNSVASIPIDGGFVELDALVANAPTVAQGTAGGAPDAGYHYYGVTFVNGAGESGIANISAAILAGANKIALSVIQVGPSGTTARKIYRTKANAPTNGVAPDWSQFFLLGTIADNVTTTFSDNALPDSGLGAAPPATGAGTQLVEYAGVNVGANQLTGCIGGAGIMANGQNVKFYAYGLEINMGDVYVVDDVNFACNNHAVLFNLKGNIRNALLGAGHFGGSSGGTDMVLAYGKGVTIRGQQYVDNVKGDRGGLWVCPMASGVVSDLHVDIDQFNIQDGSLGVPVVLDGANMGGSASNCGYGYILGGKTNGHGGGSGDCPAFLKFVNNWPSGAGVALSNIIAQSTLNLYVNDGTSAAKPDQIDAATILLTSSQSNGGAYGVPLKIPQDTTAKRPAVSVSGDGGLFYDTSKTGFVQSDGTAWRLIQADHFFDTSTAGGLTPNMKNGKLHRFTETAAGAFNVNAPTNVQAGQQLILIIKNGSGGAIVATFNAIFLFPFGAWADPANTKSRKVTFDYDGTNWVANGAVSADY